MTETKWKSIFGKKPTDSQPTQPKVQKELPKTAPQKIEAKEPRFAFAKAPIEKEKQPSKIEKKEETKKEEQPPAKKRGRPSNADLMARVQEQKAQEQIKKAEISAVEPNRVFFDTGDHVSISYPWGLTLTGVVVKHDPKSRYAYIEWSNGKCWYVAAEILKREEKKVKIRRRRGRKKKK